jgi:predicted double-glycine peptidase
VWWLTLLLTFQQALWIDVPFIRQDKEGCGSAAIGMVLKYWQPEAEVDVDAIQRQLFSKSAGGIYAKDVVRYLESRGYRVFAFRGEWSDLENHIAKGRPLIVALEPNARRAPLHYVVVAGVDSAQGLVLVNDPAQRKLLSISRAEFERDWKSTDNWTLLAVPELNLASQAFREEKLTETREHLASALRLNPSDQFANDFLATVYFLQDNTEAAIKYWNLAGKPSVDNIRIDPPVRIDPLLLDRTFAFSRGSVLRLSDYEKTEAKLDALGVFSRYRLELSPSEGGRFDLTLHAAERSGLNIRSWARGLPFQSVNPGFSNIGGKAVNVGSMIRWDPNKRRAFVFVETPLGGDPKWNLHTAVDARDEVWASSSGGFRLKKIQASAEIRGVPDGRWSWTSGASVSSGVQLKYSGSITRTVVREPSRHVRWDSSVSIEAGKMFSASPLRFAKLVHRNSFRWRSFTSEVRAGRIVGSAPFDERFMVGLDRDSDLWLRAHTATIDGRKNAENTTGVFVLTNSDFQKPVYRSPWFRVSAGPFLDTGKSSVDTGLELRLNVLESFGIKFSYGRSLTDSKHAFFIRE